MTDYHGRRSGMLARGFAAGLSLCLAAAAARPAAPQAKEVGVPAGTEVSVRAKQDIFSSIVLAGETLDFFEVAEDVVVEGRVVIRRGARVLAKVLVAKRPRAFGRGGRLQIAIEQAATADGQWVLLRGEELKSKGRPRVGEAAALAVLIGPGGAMLEGKHARIKEGTVVRTLTAEAKSVRAAP